MNESQHAAKNEKIGVKQFLILVILFSLGSAVLIIPTRLVAEAKQDAWISALIGLGIGFMFISFFNIFSKQFPRFTLVEATEAALGMWLGKGFSFISKSRTLRKFY